ncbi:MFS transporter [Kushneria phyllosphaerae]|uniref:Inner membrane protein YbjJ n=1 Tax=Kushneria phyllosphaerae TaxID=2100822 RepID=A0A2R8CGR9_9GAMM|nr:MFS transporter [Kushneria phyllosphaerae]SPJ32091.1 Inner membrane protein YbjJ [Kushneria phyllosphaerae]
MNEPAGESITTHAPASRAAIAWFFALSGLSFSNWAVRIPDIRTLLDLSQSQLGALLLCPVVGSLCLTLLSNYLNTRFGSRRITRVAACAIVVSLVLIGAAVSMLTLGLALVVFGAGMGLLNIAMNDQAATLERRYRRSIMSSFHGLFSLGGMAGSLIGGALATLGLTPRWHLLLVAGLLMVGILISHRHLLAPPPRAERPVGALFVRPKGRVWLLGIIAAAVVFIEGSMADWSALFLTELGASRGHAALGLAVFTGTMAVGRLLGDRWLDRVGAIRALEAGSALALFGLGLAIVAASPTAALLGFALAGIGMSTLFPCLLSLAGRNRAMSPSGAIASVAMLGYLSMLGGPPMLGFLAEAITLHYAFIALAVAAALAIALARPAAKA